jgi:tRNA 2-thiouridine synthesizing protein A
MLHRAIRQITSGELLVVESTDPSSLRDIPKFCIHLGHVLQSQQTMSINEGYQKEIYRFEIIKG